MPMRLSGFAFVLAMPWLQIQLSRAQETPIDTARSTITIHAGKAGLLSSATHHSGRQAQQRRLHWPTALKQNDVGIKPVSVGGGMIRVKNEIDFEVYPK